MNATEVLTIIEKGISVVAALIAAGNEAIIALQAVRRITAAAKAGTVTDEDLAATEALLDAMIEDFNLELADD